MKRISPAEIGVIGGSIPPIEANLEHSWPVSRILYQMSRTSFAFAAFVLSTSFSFAQWAETQKIGTGGETFVSTDGKGNVYATSHQPARLYVSHDFGKTFGSGIPLPDSFCDVCSTVGPDGKLYVIYIRPNVSGMQVVTLSNDATNVVKGGTLVGPYDREWIVVDPKTNAVGFDYSDGYIGGPKSKGVFYAQSTDQGQNFKTVSRIDKEPEGSYPVDPYLTIGTGGRIYAGWATSSDYNTIDAYRVATSDDGGKTWANHTDVGTTHPGFGDTQERWMLGSLTAAGADTAMMVYEDYVAITVDGQEVRPHLVFYRVTTDGGKTWSSAKTCLSPREIEASIHEFLEGEGKSAVTATYNETLPWICADGHGNIHMAFVDNRAGTTMADNKKVGLWQVRATTWRPGSGFGPSEVVSEEWAAGRPPLDFLSCCCDASNMWVSWTEDPNNTGSWDFSGNFYIAHKKF